MSGFKKLNQQDVYVSTYNAQKQWTLSASDQNSLGVTGSAYTSSSNAIDLDPAVLTYHSLHQLYYSNFDQTGSITTTGSYDNFVESSFATSSRSLGTDGIVFSIPRDIFGTHIEPGTFTLGSNDGFIESQDSYILTDYIEGGTLVLDNGEGVLYKEESGDAVGNIIYTHGQVIITDSNYKQAYITSPDYPITLKSNLPIYTYNYNIKVSDYEFNFTNNPTAQSGSTVLEYSGSKYVQPSGVLADSVTGSYFQPYITSVGLYNDANELIAVAKLAQPLPKPANTELTIQIKLDI
jgi:hypothetical protein